MRAQFLRLIVILGVVGGGAGQANADDGKLLATGGISTVEGAGGGGLVPWALIGGYETRDGIGLTVHATAVPLADFTLYSPGVALGLYDRVELSYAANLFDTGGTGGKLGLGNGFTFHEDVYGLKVKIAGDAVYDQDRILPQIAVGLEYKSNENAALLRALGASSADGLDYYVSATKIILDRSLVLNATIRMTRANQFGILGFGGPKDSSYQPEFEGSAALLLSRQLALGGEYRMKPDNLAFASEDNAYDVFVAYFFNKSISGTLAYTDLGSIATFNDQRGAFLSLQYTW
jgi:hypothetical protein